VKRVLALAQSAGPEQEQAGDQRFRRGPDKGEPPELQGCLAECGYPGRRRRERAALG